MYMKITRFARGSKGGWRGASGLGPPPAPIESSAPRADSPASNWWRMPGRRIDPALRERRTDRREGANKGERWFIELLSDRQKLHLIKPFLRGRYGPDQDQA